jgi:hypothetical protein
MIWMCLRRISSDRQIISARRRLLLSGTTGVHRSAGGWEGGTQAAYNGSRC